MLSRCSPELGEVRLIEKLETCYVQQQFIEAAAVLTRGRRRISRQALQAGRQLKCVARCGAGTDNIDVAAATELGLPVFFFTRRHDLRRRRARDDANAGSQPASGPS